MDSHGRIEFAGAEGNRLVGDVFGGTGRPVLFFHGGGQTRRAWDTTARRVAAAGFSAVTIDLRGHGESDWVASGHYTFVDFADDVTAVIRQSAGRWPGRATVVGASLGGLAALTAEVRHGPLIGALVLVDITPRMDPDGVAKVQGFMSARVEEGFASLEEAAAAIATYLPHRRRLQSLDGLAKNLRRSADGRYRWHWDPTFMSGRRSIHVGAQALMDDIVNALPALDTPVLLVRGGQSELVSEAEAVDFVGRIKHGRTIDVGGAGHMVAGDRNDAFAEAILDFLVEPAPA